MSVQPPPHRNFRFHFLFNFLSYSYINRMKDEDGPFPEESITHLIDFVINWPFTRLLVMLLLRWFWLRVPFPVGWFATFCAIKVSEFLIVFSIFDEVDQPTFDELNSTFQFQTKEFIALKISNLMILNNVNGERQTGWQKRSKPLEHTVWSRRWWNLWVICTIQLIPSSSSFKTVQQLCQKRGKVVEINAHHIGKIQTELWPDDESQKIHLLCCRVAFLLFVISCDVIRVFFSL